MGRAGACVVGAQSAQMLSTYLHASVSCFGLMSTLEVGRDGIMGGFAPLSRITLYKIGFVMHAG